MKFIISKNGETILRVARKIGYILRQFDGTLEYDLVRPMGVNAYPRFHLYAKEQGDAFLFNLHLDQKQPSYGGTRAHAGEYDGELVEGEAARIQQILKMI